MKSPARYARKNITTSVVEVIQQETGAYTVNLWRLGHGLCFDLEEWRTVVGEVSNLMAQLQDGDKFSQKQTQKRIRDELVGE